jgi:two-component system chemotaxis response regulator CheY
MRISLENMMSDTLPNVSNPDSQTEKRGPLHILIVDDDVVQRQLLQRASRLAGCDVVLASSCTEAVDLVRTMPFDCVVLDLELEDGDGVDVCRVMADTNYSGAVIIVSGTESRRRSAARAVARSVGIEAQSLPKPVDLASLRVCLANLGKGRQGLPAIHPWGGTAVGQTVEGHRVEAACS